MNRTLKILICLFAAAFAVSGSFATNSFHTTYSHPRVEMTLIYNYSYIPLGVMLEYKAIAEILNDYAEQRVREGRLDGGRKIQIVLDSSMNWGYQIEMWRSLKHYYFSIRGQPGIEELIRVVDYFAHPEWQSLVYDNLDHGESVLRLYARRLEKYVPEADLSLADGRSVKVYCDGDIEITYKDKNLSVSLGGSILEDIDIGNIHPVKFRDRYIVFEHEKFTVYGPDGDGNPQPLLTYKIPADTGYNEYDHDYFTEVYADWMNVYFNNHDYPRFSYCYSRNKFYIVERE